MEGNIERVVEIIGVLLIGLFALARNIRQRRAKNLPTIRIGSIGAVVWWLTALLWIGAFSVSLIILALFHRQFNVGQNAVTGSIIGALLIAFVPLFLSWPLLRFVARGGHVKWVYVLGRALLVGARSDDTGGAPLLLAGLALAHRGQVTVAERKWLKKRLAKVRKANGAFACAVGILESLRAKDAHDKGHFAEANRRWGSARALFGSVTYLSRQAAPPAVLDVAVEWLALNDARLGRWEGLLGVSAPSPPDTYLALRYWARVGITREKAIAQEIKARKRLKSPQIEMLFSRAERGRPLDAPETARAIAGQAYALLISGEPVGPRTLIKMVCCFDSLLDLHNAFCVLPDSIRVDEGEVRRIQDEVASALADVLSHDGLPLHVLLPTEMGPISTRLLEKLELLMTGELRRALAQIETQLKEKTRSRNPIDDWTDASRVRALFRRLEYTLGQTAARAHYSRYMQVYSRLGVSLSAEMPLRRSASHAIFASLYHDAFRFGDEVNVALMSRNKVVTAQVN